MTQLLRLQKQQLEVVIAQGILQVSPDAHLDHFFRIWVLKIDRLPIMKP